MSSQPLRRSRRLASIIPASYWSSIGYTEDNALAMERLQENMKEYCDGGGETTIRIYGRGEEVLPHHDMMLPHWKKLAKSLSGRTSINSIQICSVSLPISVLDVMFSALHSVDITQLVLDGTDLGKVGLHRLISFLGDNKSLRYLGIGEDLLNDISIASSLSDSIQNHPSLERVGLSSCGLNNYDVFEKVLEGCTGLESLSCTFEESGLDVTGLSNFIGSNHRLERIMMKQCNISDNDILLLASALKMNTHLIQLDLTDNKITEEGDNNLLKALFDPTSMDSIIESNHTCMAHTYDVSNASVISQRPAIEKEVFAINNNGSIKQKIRKKVVLALCGVDGGLFDLSHLNDLPLKLMPRVLELIQEYTASRGKDLIRIHTRPEQI